MNGTHARVVSIPSAVQAALNLVSTNSSPIKNFMRQLRHLCPGLLMHAVKRVPERNVDAAVNACVPRSHAFALTRRGAGSVPTTKTFLKKFGVLTFTG